MPKRDKLVGGSPKEIEDKLCKSINIKLTIDDYCILIDRTEKVQDYPQGEKFGVYVVWSTQESKLNFYYEDPRKLDLYKERQQQQSQQHHSSHYDDSS